MPTTKDEASSSSSSSGSRLTHDASPSTNDGRLPLLPSVGKGPVEVGLDRRTSEGRSVDAAAAVAFSGDGVGGSGGGMGGSRHGRGVVAAGRLLPLPVVVEGDELLHRLYPRGLEQTSPLAGGRGLDVIAFRGVVRFRVGVSNFR